MNDFKKKSEDGCASSADGVCLQENLAVLWKDLNRKSNERHKYKKEAKEAVEGGEPAIEEAKKVDYKYIRD